MDSLQKNVNRLIALVRALCLQKNVNGLQKNANYTKEQKNEHHKKMRELFDLYWFSYPKAGRLNYEACFKRFKLIRKSIPSPGFFCGFLNAQSDIWDARKEGYVPAMLQTLEGEDWNKLELPMKKHIEANLMHWEGIMLLKVKKAKEGA